MNLNDFVMVSVDDHVVEPPDLFDGRLARKYREYAPEFITNADGTNVWKYNGETVMNVALNAVAGRPNEEYGIEPTSFTQLRPGTYDTWRPRRLATADGGQPPRASTMADRLTLVAAVRGISATNSTVLGTL
ncbi:MAG: amidohydrolase 2 [Mycobacterium sp.]|jgi:hypothetical protein|nr:amidohydrolase 2 [Mycobacterium sp.]